MKRLALLLAMIACGPSLREMNDHNQRAIDAANASDSEAGPVFTPAITSIPRTSATVPVSSLERDEVLYGDQAGQLVFVSDACAVPARCGNGCARPIEYSFHHAADGHVVIVRKRYVEQIVRRESDPSCPAGCGGGAAPTALSPPTEIAGSALGVTAVAQVELRTVTYTVQVVDRVCTNTTPIP